MKLGENGKGNSALMQTTLLLSLARSSTIKDNDDAINFVYMYICQLMCNDFDAEK